MPSLTFLLGLSLAIAGPASSQKPYAAMSSDELTRAFLEQTKRPKDSAAQNYTFVILHHDINYDKNGNQLSDHSYKSEQIFIGGLPYIRRLERNGKPLEGAELAHENELYDKAVEERKGLTDTDRYKASKRKSFSTQLFPIDRALTDFIPTLDGTKTIAGHQCLVLDLSPVRPDLPATSQRHTRLCLNAENLDVLENDTEYLADDNHFEKGTHIVIRNAYVDGTLLTSSSRMDGFFGQKALLRTVHIHLLSTDDYSNYRRFRTEITLSPANVAPEE